MTVTTMSLIRQCKNRSRAAVKFPIPENKRDVRSFLGLAGYYRKLIKNYAALAVALTRKNTPSKVVWTGECDRAFESVKAQ